MKPRREQSVLIIGVGGLGCPAALALGLAGVGKIGLADDDAIDLTNLHRQILFDERDVGSRKVATAAERLRQRFPDLLVETHEARLLPHNAVDLVLRYDVVVEGSDNFATKFLAADACSIAKVPVVHGAAVRWHGTALAVSRLGQPCYRCLFEDLPREHAPNCAEAGVVGPVVGILGAVQADLALALLGGSPAGGTLVTYDGLRDLARSRRIQPNPRCSLCREADSVHSRTIDASRYATDACDAH